MRLDFETSLSGFELPAVRRISWRAPFAWLHAGWRDLYANPIPALAYGLLFGIGGDLIILAALDRPHLVTVAFSGFFLVAPLLAAGLYELSRAAAHGERLIFVESLRCFRRNLASLLLFGLMLALCALLWERFTAIVFTLLGDAAGAGLGGVAAALGRGEYLFLAAIWMAMGAILALFVFAVGVVAVPLMVDRRVDLATAMVTSLHAFASNPGPLLAWAALIVLLTVFGFVTLLFGMVLIMPWLGHASWHAYRDLVE